MAEADGPRISISEVGALPAVPGNLQADGVPTRYEITVYYFDNSGKVMMPTAGPPGSPSQFLDWSAPHQKMLVCWLAKCLGAWPVPPSPEPPSDNHVYLDGKPWMLAPEFLPGNKAYEYTVGGYYLYGLKIPVPLKEVYKTCAKVPFDTGTHPTIDPGKLKKLFS